MSKTAILAVRVDSEGKDARKDIDSTAKTVTEFGKTTNKLDLSKAARELESFGREVDDAGDKAKKQRRSVDDLGEAAGNSSSAASQAAGGFGDLGAALAAQGGAVGALGSAMESATVPIMGLAGAADLAELATGKLNITTIKNGVATAAQKVQTIAAAGATAVMTGAQTALNAVMSANPILLVVLALAAVAGGLVLAYKKSETFRNAVDSLFGAVKNVAGAISSGFGAALDFLKTWGPRALLLIAPFIGIPLLIAQNFDKISGFLKTALDAGKRVLGGFIDDVVKAALGLPGKLGSLGTKLGGALVDAIKAALNNLLHLPLAIPGFSVGPVHFGGVTLIPRLAEGATINPRPGGTMAILAEAGRAESVVDTGKLNRMIAATTRLVHGIPQWMRASSGGSGLGPDLNGGLTSSAPFAAVVVNVEFNGLVTDPDATAAEIERLLRSRNIRLGVAA